MRAECWFLDSLRNGSALASQVFQQFGPLQARSCSVAIIDKPHAGSVPTTFGQKSPLPFFGAYFRTAADSYLGIMTDLHYTK